MIVRPAESADREEWLRMRAHLWPSSASDHAREVEALVTSGHPFAVFVAEATAGGLAGFIEVGTRDYAEGCSTSPVAFIEGWWVDAATRRSGVGARLIEAAEAWARTRDLTEIASDTELTNVLSQSAHRALGYQEVERVVCYRKRL